MAEPKQEESYNYMHDARTAYRTATIKAPEIPVGIFLRVPNASSRQYRLSVTFPSTRAPNPSVFICTGIMGRGEGAPRALARANGITDNKSEPFESTHERHNSVGSGRPTKTQDDK
mmetsp:Transcript_64593/g.131388  ORF Transcript_64593/g.131388 Transcript_64593/m.131388 type:complete len:116 (-) Transcript_64593:556-903(-)